MGMGQPPFQSPMLGVHPSQNWYKKPCIFDGKHRPLLIITVNLPHQAMESQSTAPPRSRSPPSLDNEPTLNACCRGKNVSSKKACQRHQTLDCFLMFFVLDHLTYQCWWSNSRFFDQIQTSNAVSNAGITVTETEGWHWTYHHLVAVLHFWT